MALNLFARSFSWVGLTLQQAVRPIGIVQFDASCKLRSGGNVTDTRSLREPGIGGESKAASPASGCNGGGRPAASSGSAQVHTFAAMAVKQGVGAESQESNVARQKRNSASEGLGVGWGGEERLGPQRPKGGNEARHQWVGCDEALYQQLTGWPVDVNLHEKLKNGKVLGVQINEMVVRAVLHRFKKGGKFVSVIDPSCLGSSETSLRTLELRFADDDS